MKKYKKVHPADVEVLKNLKLKICEYLLDAERQRGSVRPSMRWAMNYLETAAATCKMTILPDITHSTSLRSNKLEKRLQKASNRKAAEAVSSLYQVQQKREKCIEQLRLIES